MPEEWAILRSIRLAALRESPRSFCSAYEREAGWDEDAWRQWSRSVAWFLAWRDGRPVGIAGGTSGGGPSAEPASGATPPAGHRSGGSPGDERQVISMWVDPAARGTGIADAMFGAVAGWARADGAKTLKLWVTDASPRARAFYRRAGFRPTGSHQKQTGEQDLELEELSIDLGVWPAVNRGHSGQAAAHS